MWVLVAPVLLAIEIHASGTCPAASDIEKQMAPLLGDGATAAASDVATIEHSGDGTLVVSLRDGVGRPIGDRRFPAVGTCGDQAASIAVTLAIWEAQIHPEITLHLDRLSTGAGPSTQPAAAAKATSGPALVTKPAPFVMSTGASLAGDWQSGAWAPSGRVELGFGRLDSRWRARLGVVGVAKHTVDVAPGRAIWWRASLVVGGDREVARGKRWAVLMGGGVLGGLVSIAGEGYAVDHQTLSLDAGAELRVRGEWRPGRVRPWVGASTIAWLRRQSLDLEGAASSSILPRVEPMVALGADFVW